MTINELAKLVAAGKIVTYRQAREVIRLLGEQLRAMDDSKQAASLRAIVRGNLDTTVHYADPRKDIGVRGNG